MAAAAAFVNTDICLVLDRSGSMKRNAQTGTLADGDRCQPPKQNSRWAALEDAVNTFIDIIEVSPAIPKVAMVSFSSDHSQCEVESVGAETDVPLVYTEDLHRITTAMEDRSARPMIGDTDIALGIQVGQSVLTSADSRPTAFKFMIVMTDGGYTEDDPVPYAEIAAAHDIQVHTITFSDAANTVDMISVANAGNGVHYHAETTEDLIAVFKELAGSITKGNRVTRTSPQTFLLSLIMRHFNHATPSSVVNHSHRRSLNRIGLRNRRGAAAVEFAMTAPLFFMVLFAGIEFSRANILRNLCDNAALEAARVGVVPGATAERCIASANAALDILHVQNATVTVEPSTILPNTPELTVTVSIPLEKNAMPMSAYVMGTTLVRSATLKRSQ